MAPEISQLQNIYSYLQQYGINATATSSESNFMNTIWSSIQDFENISGGNDQQKVSGIQNLLSKAMSLIENLAGGTNEASNAAKETKKNNSDASKLNQEVATTEEQLVAEIDKIKSELDGHIAVITTATSNIEGKKEDLDRQLKALKTIQEQIEQKQEALKTAKPEDKVALLNDIKTLSSLIPAITGILSGIQQSMETESQNVTNAYTAVETLKGNAVDLQSDAEGKIISLSSSAVQEVQDNLQANQTGTSVNKPTAKVAKDSADAAAKTPFGATSAPKLYRVSADQEIAATVRISGAGTNLQSVQQGIGRLNSTNEALVGFSNDIETQLNTFNDAIGNWDSVIQPMITSIGSANYDDIGSASEELVAVTESDLAILAPQNTGVQDYWASYANEQSATQNGAQSFWSIASSSQKPNQEESVVPLKINEDLKTTQFDLSKLGIVKKEIK